MSQPDLTCGTCSGTVFGSRSATLHGKLLVINWNPSAGLIGPTFCTLYDGDLPALAALGPYFIRTDRVNKLSCVCCRLKKLVCPRDVSEESLRLENLNVVPIWCVKSGMVFGMWGAFRWYIAEDLLKFCLWVLYLWHGDANKKFGFYFFSNTYLKDMYAKKLYLTYDFEC